MDRLHNIEQFFLNDNHNKIKAKKMAKSKYFIGIMGAASLVSINVNANLNDVPGQNGVQTATAAAIQTLCPQMGALGGAQNDLPEGQQQLFERCRELVQTSNLQQAVGGVGFSLDLSEDQLRQALQRIAPEEVGAMGSGATDTSHDQIGNVGSRLQFLRVGAGGAAVAGMQWSGDQLAGGAAGSDEFSKLGLFINGSAGFGDKDTTSEEDGFDYNAENITIGVDYRLSDALVAGVALGISQSDVDMDNNFGSTESDGFSTTLYGTYYTGNFYTEAMLSFSRQEYNGERNVAYANVSQVLISDTDGDQFAWSLGGGYSLNKGKWNADFFGRIESVDSDVDGFTESGGELAMIIGKQNIESLQGVIGAQVSATISTGMGVILPYGGIAFHHEFDDDQRAINTRYVFDPTETSFSFNSDDADSNFGILSVGASMVLVRGNQIFLNYDTVLGMDNVSSSVITAGIRFEL